MLGFIGKKIFGTQNDRILKGIRPVVDAVNELEPRFKALQDSELAAMTVQFRERLAQGETLDALLPEAFATVREASRRVLGMRHFDVQIIGGTMLHRGNIAEMRTGEGKTLVSTLPAYLNALTGKGVHIVTVNDYLARRDCEWMGRIHRFLGLTVGVVYSGMREEQKREAYAADITYGQNNEFGFDYLRDNMKFEASDMFQRGHNFAIVDEVDSILIDEARTPLIISGPSDDATDKYGRINTIIPSLKKDEDYEIELRTKQPTLTDEGIAHVEQLLGITNLYDPQHIELLHHVVQALRAYTTMTRDVDYVVKDGQVIIVDEFTGRLMPGRRWSDGLHQAVEAKEGLKVARENQTLASITFQNYFRMYQKLSGMTGTADTEAVEFKKIYNLDVVVIPPNRGMVRVDESDQVFRTRKEKYEAVVKDIKETNKTGQPILVGTISIEQSETLSKMLQREGVPHHVLNAKAHEREAEIVAQAGRFGAVTISTNMAGRGTDILLGGNPEFLAQDETGSKDREDPEYQEAHARYAAQCAADREKVVAAGGLFVIGTERHESRRIDNQLRGRAGRQGDAGRSRFYISLEDDLMKRFGGDKIQMLMQRLGWEEGVAMDGRMISRSIETAQKRVEGFHFEHRKHVTEYDDVMNKQRQVIYNLRSRILNNEGIEEEIATMIDDLCEDTVLSVCDERVKPTLWELPLISERFTTLFKESLTIPESLPRERQAFFDFVRAAAKKAREMRTARLTVQLEELRALFTAENNPFDFSTAEVERDIFLKNLDGLWLRHLQQMDYLREGIGLRGYGQKNPLHEYQKEGFALFQQLLAIIKENVIRQIFYYQLPEAKEYLAYLEAEQKRREKIEAQMQLSHEATLADAAPATKEGKDPEDQKAKIQAQRKERRKLSR
jgi:preprotein translocase subunit SecA